MLTRRAFAVSLAAAGGGLFAAPRLLAAPARPAMTTFHDPGCGCCGKWAEAMRKAGFAVTVTDMPDMAAVKRRFGVPQALQSCHTTVVGGLVVEGHVPAEPIRRLLKARPAGLVGIAAPGMPRGAPGMEMPDGSQDPLRLTLFFRDGRSRLL